MTVEQIADKPVVAPWSAFKTFCSLTALTLGISLLGKPFHYVEAPGRPCRYAKVIRLKSIECNITNAEVKPGIVADIQVYSGADPTGAYVIKTSLAYSGIGLPSGSPAMISASVFGLPTALIPNWIPTWPNWHSPQHDPSLYPPQFAAVMQGNQGMTFDPYAPATAGQTGCQTTQDISVGAGNYLHTCFCRGNIVYSSIDTSPSFDATGYDNCQGQADLPVGERIPTVPTSISIISDANLTGEVSGRSGVLERSIYKAEGGTFASSYWGVSGTFSSWDPIISAGTILGQPAQCTSTGWNLLTYPIIRYVKVNFPKAGYGLTSRVTTEGLGGLLPPSHTGQSNYVIIGITHTCNRNAYLFWGHSLDRLDNTTYPNTYRPELQVLGTRRINITSTYNLKISKIPDPAYNPSKIWNFYVNNELVGGGVTASVKSGLSQGQEALGAWAEAGVEARCKTSQVLPNFSISNLKYKVDGTDSWSNWTGQDATFTQGIMKVSWQGPTGGAFGRTPV